VYQNADGSRTEFVYPGRSTAVLDTGPHSYWRLDEASGTTAASSVLANEGTDNATYSGVTLGKPGPLAGSTATAASFNGTSSYLKLPTNLVSGASYQSLAVWFKTTTINGVIFGSSADPITDSSTPRNYTPNLYVDSHGNLRGEFWNGKATPITSSSAVTDGNWHLAVLTAAGDTQTLYLDGRVVGSLSGTVNNAAALKHGTHLRTPGSNQNATVTSGHTPRAWSADGISFTAGTNLYEKIVQFDLECLMPHRMTPS
jgi:hypothetical protein